MELELIYANALLTLCHVTHYCVMMLSLEVSNIIHSHLCQVFFPLFLHNFYQNKFVLLKEAKKIFGWNCVTFKNLSM